MKIIILAVLLLNGTPALWADDADFATHLFPKFQVKACTICHDFFEKKLDGIFYSTHKSRSPNTCVLCHKKKVTGFEHPDEWFAQPGLYTSDMDAKQTCETIKEAMNVKFKNKTLAARQMKKHLFEDPRVLWGIKDATPNSGKLPKNKEEKDLVQGGLKEWKKQVRAWIKGGLKCPDKE
jgi:hypothetical protein